MNSLKCFCKNLLFGLVIPVLMLACATTSSDLGKLRLGMSKDEVIMALGKPHAVSAEGTVEFLTYNLDNDNIGGKSPYFVRLLNGTVDGFGRAGDFGTTMKPKERLEITYPKPEQK